MKEIINSIFDTTKERIKNPFLGAFIFSWAIFNWKPILYIVLSENSIENKIDFISECYSSIDIIFCFPLICSIFYLVIFPYILWAFDKLSSKAIIGRKENALNLNISDIRNKQKIAVEESELENIKASYKDKADLNKKIEILNNQLNEKEELIEMQNEEYTQIVNEQNRLKEFIKNDKNSNFSENESFKNLFSDFRKTDMYDFFREIGTEISRRNELPNQIDDLIIEKYKILEIIREERDKEAQKTIYKFTPKGDSFWKQYLMNLSITKKSKEQDDLPF